MDVVIGLLSSLTGESQSKHDLNTKAGEKAQTGKRGERALKEKSRDPQSNYASSMGYSILSYPRQPILSILETFTLILDYEDYFSLPPQL